MVKIRIGHMSILIDWKNPKNEKNEILMNEDKKDPQGLEQGSQEVVAEEEPSPRDYAKRVLGDLEVIKVFIDWGLWWLIFPEVFEDFAEGSCAFGAGRELFYQQLKAIAARQEELLNLINKFSGQQEVVRALRQELLFVQSVANKIAHVLLGSDGTVDQNTSATNGFQKTLIIPLRGEDFSKINTLVQAGLYQLVNIDQIPSLSSLPEGEVAGILLEAVNNAIALCKQRTAFLYEGEFGLATNSHGQTNDGSIATRESQEERLQSLYELRKNLVSLYLSQTKGNPPSSSE